MEPNNTTPDPTKHEPPQTPTVPPEASNNGSISADPSIVGAKRPKKYFGKLGIVPVIIIAAALLIGGSAAAYLAFVQPNQPENIWKTALDNTAKGYDKLIDYGEKQKDTKGGTLKGTFKVENAEFVTDGNINGIFDAKNSNTTIDAGVAGTRMKFNVLTNIPDGASTPDIYLKAEGLEGLSTVIGNGDPQAAEMLASINNQFYFIDHTLLEQLQKQASTPSPSMQVSDIKADDIVDFMRQLGEVNKEYVFTSDSNKSIFILKDELGKEKVDGREVYHFTVALDKEQIKAWNQAVCDRLVNHNVVKVLSNAQTDEDRKKECEDTSDYDDIDENQTADVWVDMKTKLIRTVRFAEQDGKATYEFGMLYDGGDEYPFTVSVKDDEQGDITLKTTLNTQTNVISFVVDAAMKSDDQTSAIDLDLVLTPSNESIQFTKPEGVKALSELLAPFIGGFSGSSSLELTEDDLRDTSVE